MAQALGGATSALRLGNDPTPLRTLLQQNDTLRPSLVGRLPGGNRTLNRLLAGRGTPHARKKLIDELLQQEGGLVGSLVGRPDLSALERGNFRLMVKGIHEIDASLILRADRWLKGVWWREFSRCCGIPDPQQKMSSLRLESFGEVQGPPVFLLPQVGSEGDETRLRFYQLLLAHHLLSGVIATNLPIPSTDFEHPLRQVVEGMWVPRLAALMSAKGHTRFAVLTAMGRDPEAHLACELAGVGMDFCAISGFEQDGFLRAGGAEDLIGQLDLSPGLPVVAVFADRPAWLSLLGRGRINPAVFVATGAQEVFFAASPNRPYRPRSGELDLCLSQPVPLEVSGFTAMGMDKRVAMGDRPWGLARNDDAFATWTLSDERRVFVVADGGGPEGGLVSEAFVKNLQRTMSGISRLEDALLEVNDSLTRRRQALQDDSFTVATVVVVSLDGTVEKN